MRGIEPLSIAGLADSSPGAVRERALGPARRHGQREQHGPSEEDLERRRPRMHAVRGAGIPPQGGGHHEDQPRLRDGGTFADADSRASPALLECDGASVGAWVRRRRARSQMRWHLWVAWCSRRSCQPPARFFQKHRRCRNQDTPEVVGYVHSPDLATLPERRRPKEAWSGSCMGDRARTCNLRFWRPLLSQLSYTHRCPRSQPTYSLRKAAGFVGRGSGGTRTPDVRDVWFTARCNSHYATLPRPRCWYTGGVTPRSRKASAGATVTGVGAPVCFSSTVEFSNDVRFYRTLVPEGGPVPFWWCYARLKCEKPPAFWSVAS